jgi:serine/threonine protein kinase
MAPEILQSSNRHNYDEMVDIWALGIIVYELLHGSPPFSDPSFQLTCRNIIACDLQISQKISAHASDFIRCILRKVNAPLAVHGGESTAQRPLVTFANVGRAVADAPQNRWCQSMRPWLRVRGYTRAAVRVEEEEPAN